MEKFSLSKPDNQENHSRVRKTLTAVDPRIGILALRRTLAGGESMSIKEKLNLALFGVGVLSRIPAIVILTHIINSHINQ